MWRHAGCVGATIALSLVPRAASAWSIGYPLDSHGCHEPITAEALGNVRTMFSTAPEIVPDRDEAALIDDVQFSPPSDVKHDLAGMTLILGVRDNDVKGRSTLDALDITEVHGNPANQDEHCLRSDLDDGPQGEQAAMAACRAFILMRATEALEGLDASGTVDAGKRVPFTVTLSIAGRVDPELPLFYIKIGQAMHALQDGFTHTYRTADGMRVTVVLNWIDWVTGHLDEQRDGPPHLASLDHCQNDDPLIVRNVDLAVEASTELLAAALNPALSREQKIAAFEAITVKYLTFEQGCAFENEWCDAAEAKVQDISRCGCRVAGSDPWGFLPIAGALAFLWRRRFRRAASVTILVLAAATQAHAQTSADQPKEPGRDVKTPTPQEIQEVREDKKLGPRLGYAFSIGGAIDQPAAIARLGLRYRFDEMWQIGLDGEWNPWITTTPLRMRAGSMNFALVGIVRFPMKFDRVNLRSTLRAGTSTLLFDVFGAKHLSTGPFFGVSVLGIDIDLGGSLRIVIDPAEISVPVPAVTPQPLFYEQFRFMVGLQYGS